MTLEIVFVGRSNVGKSSVIKALTGKRLLVGRRPGITREPMQLRFKDLLITDMPGFGFMRGVPEKRQEQIKDKIVRYIEENSERIFLAVLVLDAGSFVEVVDRWLARGEIPVETEMFDFILELGLDVVVAVNKMDKVEDPDSSLDSIVDRLGMYPPWRQWLDRVAPISAKKNETGALRERIREKLHEKKRDDLLAYIKAV